MTLRFAPANDDFANPTVVPADPPADITGLTKYATKQSGEPDHAGEPGGHSVWFSWSLPSAARSISRPARPTAARTRCSRSTRARPGHAQPGRGKRRQPHPSGFPECRGTDSSVRIDAVAGTTYGSRSTAPRERAGRYNLRLRGRPANDDFAAAEEISPSLPSSPYLGTSTRLATKQSGEPDHAGEPGGHSVWFSWTPAVSGPVAITACSYYEEDLDTVLAVYTGAGLGSLAPVAANDDSESGSCEPGGSEVQFAATAGTTYWLAVDGKAGAEGRFSINLQGGDTNDDFDQAKALSPTLPVSSLGSNLLATKQSRRA